MRPRHGVGIACSAAALLLAAACGGSETPPEAEAAEPAGAMVLFLLHSEGATMAPRGGGERTYRIELTRPSEQVIAFAHRPDRRTNHARLDQFLEYWSGSDFDRNPPNASMVLTARDGSEHVVVATLERPALDASTGKLSFDATVLSDRASGGVSVYPAPGAGAGPREFADAAVFVDANATVAPPRPGAAPRAPRTPPAAPPAPGPAATSPQAGPGGPPPAPVGVG